jgi:serine/threonine-protein kinase
MEEVRFGDYRVTETIGTGALSTIYKAVKEPLGRVVALKALKSQIAPTSSFGEQLDREAKILADLTHPNVVLLLESSRTSSGRPYVVLEHVDGPSLQDVLAVFGRDAKARGNPAKRRSLGVAATLAIACSVCSALEHVHERGIVHRDVKPSNVLLARSGVVKLIDFGIAQRPRTHSVSDALGEGITASGRMAPEPLKDAFGTPAYMSPEQILGDFVDGRSDLFSLGVVLYHMLSGVRPFESRREDARDDKRAPSSAAKQERSAAQRIRRDPPPPLRERAPDCPRAVERIVMRLLEKSPDDRFPSAGAVKERLEAALRAETREDPRSLVRAALADAGFGAPAAPKSAPRNESKNDAESAPAANPRPDGVPEHARGTRGIRTISVLRALLGFGAVAGVFVLGIAVIESGGAAREARSAGARPLELAPERAGGLGVVATPWAHVRVDGQLLETTPFARPIPLAAGKHWVTLSHPDAVAPIERPIEVTAGETMTLEVTLDVSGSDAGKDAR